MKTLLTKARRRDTVDIDGEAITIQELSLADAKALNADAADDMTQTLRLIVASVIGEDGKRVYTADDIPALAEALSLPTVKALGEAIGKLNGFDAEKKT